MYAKCLFCSSSLGRNKVLEQMPEGRRVAFDLRRGRLWAVCPACGRWNLCPFQERWEVLEKALLEQGRRGDAIEGAGSPFGRK